MTSRKRAQSGVKADKTSSESAYSTWKRKHILQSPPPPKNFFFNSLDEFSKGKEEARKTGGIIFCRLSPLSQNYATPFSLSKTPAFFLGSCNYGQTLSIPEKLKFGYGTSADMFSGEPSETNVVFPMTNKVVLVTHELESLKSAFPFIQKALKDLDKEATDGQSRQLDFKISSEVSCTIKSSGAGTGEINVYRMVSDVTNTRALSNSYQLVNFRLEELENLFNVFYDDLLISLESKFSRSRAYGMESINVDELVKKAAPRLAARVVEKVKEEGNYLLGTEQEREEELIHFIRLLTVEEVMANSSLELQKPKRGSVSRAYFSFLLTKLLHRNGAQAILAHIYPTLDEDPTIQELKEQERQLDQLIEEHDL